MPYTLLSHGSPDNTHGAQLNTLAARVAHLLDEDVTTAFLSDNTLPHDAVVLPLFLGNGKHMRQDVPKLVHNSACTLLPALGTAAEDVASMLVSEMDGLAKKTHQIFALYRFYGFEGMASSLYAHKKVFQSLSLAALHGQPSVAALLKQWKAQGVDCLRVQPMILFEGHSLAQLRAMCEPHGMQVHIQPVLSAYQGLAPLLAQRFKAGQQG